MTFGGAYAVLVYIMQAAVQSYHWITQAQAILRITRTHSWPDRPFP